jgi:hypothetical protein
MDILTHAVVLQSLGHYNPEDCTVNIINIYSRVTIYENRRLFTWHDFMNNSQHYDAFRFVAMNIQKLLYGGK